MAFRYCHEAIIAAAWKDGIEPMLLKRFANASPEELLRAHAYTYGGAINCHLKDELANQLNHGDITSLGVMVVIHHVQYALAEPAPG